MNMQETIEAMKGIMPPNRYFSVSIKFTRFDQKSDKLEIRLYVGDPHNFSTYGANFDAAFSRMKDRLGLTVHDPQPLPTNEEAGIQGKPFNPHPIEPRDPAVRPVVLKNLDQREGQEG